MNKKLWIFCVCGIALILNACGHKSQDISESGTDETVKVNEHYAEEIRERRHLTVGCKMDVPELGFYDSETDKWSGLEVELAYQTAANLFEVSVEDAKKTEISGICRSNSG